ncbi:MAG: hypothetical protein U0521_06475 [Anaerolineae bacterium]
MVRTNKPHQTSGYFTQLSREAVAHQKHRQRHRRAVGAATNSTAKRRAGADSPARKTRPDCSISTPYSPVTTNTCRVVKW